MLRNQRFAKFNIILKCPITLQQHQRINRQAFIVNSKSIFSNKQQLNTFTFFIATHNAKPNQHLITHKFPNNNSHQTNNFTKTNQFAH